MAKAKTKEAEATETKVEEAPKTELVEVKPQSTAVMTVDDDIDLEGDAGKGQNKMSAGDLAIPRYGIVQGTSPQRNKMKAEYIEGAEEGQIFESVTKKLLSGADGITVVPIYFHKVYLEWKGVKPGGGLHKNHGEDATAYNNAKEVEGGKRVTSDNNAIQESWEYYALIVDTVSGDAKPAIISMANTSVKHAKRWNYMINSLEAVIEKEGQEPRKIQAASFYGAYKLTAVPEGNDQNSWFRWEPVAAGLTFDLPHGRSIYKKAKAFLDSIERGEVKVAEPHEDYADGQGAKPAESDESPM